MPISNLLHTILLDTSKFRLQDKDGWVEVTSITKTVDDGYDYNLPEGSYITYIIIYNKKYIII
jgi:hypothetical protein